MKIDFQKQVSDAVHLYSISRLADFFLKRTTDGSFVEFVRDGVLRWRYKVSDNFVLPLLKVIASDVCVASEGIFVILNVDDGVLRCRKEMNVVVIEEGYLLASSSVSGTRQIVLERFNIRNCDHSFIWGITDLPRGSFVVVNDFVVLKPNSGDELLAYHLEDGQLAWRFFKADFLRVFGESDAIFGSLQCLGDRVIFATKRGALACVNSVDGKLLWHYRAYPYPKVDLQNQTVFCIQGGGSYVLYSLEGKELLRRDLWSKSDEYPELDQVNGEFAVALDADYLLIPSVTSGNVFVLDRLDFSVASVQRVDRYLDTGRFKINAAPKVDFGRVFVDLYNPTTFETTVLVYTVSSEAK